MDCLFARAWTWVHPSMVILSWALPHKQLTLIILLNYVNIENLAECHKNKNS